MSLETMKMGGAAALITTIDGVSVFCYTSCEFNRVFTPAAARRALTAIADRVRIPTHDKTPAAVLAAPGDGTDEFARFIEIAKKCDQTIIEAKAEGELVALMFDAGRYNDLP